MRAEHKPQQDRQESGVSSRPYYQDERLTEAAENVELFEALNEVARLKEQLEALEKNRDYHFERANTEDRLRREAEEQLEATEQRLAREISEHADAQAEYRRLVNTKLSRVEAGLRRADSVLLQQIADQLEIPIEALLRDPAPELTLRRQGDADDEAMHDMIAWTTALRADMRTVAAYVGRHREASDRVLADAVWDGQRQGFQAVREAISGRIAAPLVDEIMEDAEIILSASNPASESEGTYHVRMQPDAEPEEHSAEGVPSESPASSPATEASERATGTPGRATAQPMSAGATAEGQVSATVSRSEASDPAKRPT